MVRLRIKICLSGFHPVYIAKRLSFNLGTGALIGQIYQTVILHCKTPLRTSKPQQQETAQSAKVDIKKGIHSIGFIWTSSGMRTSCGFIGCLEESSAAARLQARLFYGSSFVHALLGSGFWPAVAKHQ